MHCPKCELGTIIPILLKKDTKHALLCDNCSTVWLEGEVVDVSTGHALSSFTDSDEWEYAVDEFEDQDQEHRSAAYADWE